MHVGDDFYFFVACKPFLSLSLHQFVSQDLCRNSQNIEIDFVEENFPSPEKFVFLAECLVRLGIMDWLVW